jgi:hypothetical protein
VLSSISDEYGAIPVNGAPEQWLMTILFRASEHSMYLTFQALAILAKEV